MRKCRPSARSSLFFSLVFNARSLVMHQAGPLSQWLFSALAEAELPVVCVETRHIQAVLKAQINKADRNDAGTGRKVSFGI
jgi:transposase